MNKRIKLKKGILHKECSDRCWLYRDIKKNKLFTNLGCEGCIFHNGKVINILLKSNTPANVIIIE